MKILFVNTFDISGGAAKAAYRLQQGIKSLGHNTFYLVQEKKVSDNNVIHVHGLYNKILKKIGSKLDKFILNLYPLRNLDIFSISFLSNGINKEIKKINPNIVHLHWIANNFISIEQLSNISYPILWTLHDTWAFTGGCHNPGDCEGFIKECGQCPFLASKNSKDLSNWIYSRKKKNWDKLNFTIITPSLWLANLARKSSLFHNLRIECIPNGIDTNLFKPIDKSAARNLFGLPTNKLLICFGAVDPIGDKKKGFHILLEAIKILTKTNKNIEVVIFGADRPDTPPDFGTKVYYCGNLNDEYSLVSLYSAADVFVVPSLQENLPNTVMESLSCGTPVVAFNIGGIPEMIEHAQNGYLAKPFSFEDLAQGISWILSDSDRRLQLGINGRKKVSQEFNIQKIARKYEDVYKSLIA